MLDFSIPAVLSERARMQPDDTAFTFVDYEHDWDGVTESLTWSQLYRRAVNLARELRRCGSPGDRAVIVAPQGLDYVVAFLGALQAGLIAVPLSVPLGGALDDRVSSVMGDTSPTIVLTTSAVADNIAKYIESKPDQIAPSVVEVDLLQLDSSDEPATRVDGSADGSTEIAYLQYTSGSTRMPAGAMVSHRNIMANFEQIKRDFFGGSEGTDPSQTTVVSWLPFYHDMGLYLGIIFPVLAGSRAVVTSPVSFLQRPARWLHLLSGNPRALSAAPNFAFELTARKTSDDDMAGHDLRHVVCLLNGSERVQPASLERFTDRFAGFGLQDKMLRPSYGMAEATVYILTRETGQPPEIVHFEAEKLTEGHAERCEIGSGTPLVSYGVAKSPLVRIVDPDTMIECPPGTTGEIWVHGENVAVGYWRKRENTENTFGATLVGASAGTPEGPWLRTGDLGFVFDDELFIIGRIKDLLIVYGRNHSPDDIEATIQTIAPGRCAAISVLDEGTEKLVAIIEQKTRAMHKLGHVKREVTSAISNSHGLSVAEVVLVPPGSIPLTTSGKVRRAACVEQYRHNRFDRLDV
ncbi:AMP-binding protein [Mycobacterium sp. 94-17]|uniref:AMP-binding protein n=1 Tax=Mycobacterium sp. 94-17 TaxID=2986147 RepID=UPI002D1F5E98|nr:AMP-binding protein [Mycobacterium sp. 94-17]MEB4211546.1 AMP-binding protein [Mycobacterium sp. 94-17]